MRLDLRFNKSIDSTFVDMFDSVSFSNRDEFNNFIDSLSRPLLNNIDWWAQSPASRNTYTSPLFHYFCCYKFLQKLVNDRHSLTLEIILDSRELKLIFEEFLERSNIDSIHIYYKPGLSLRLKRLIKNFFFFEYFCLRRYIEGVLIRYADNFSKREIQKKSITIVDTFLTIEYANNDRWYGSFWENINGDIKDEVFFIPTVIDTPLRKISSLCRKSRDDGRHILFKDHYLAIDDFFFAYSHKKRVKDLNIIEVIVDDIDFSELAREDIRHNRDVRTLIESLLIYRFFSKLKNNQIKIRHAIDWFEGHSIDKIWNLAIKEYYPNTKRVGYESFRSFPYYLSTFPIKIERDAGTIPDVFAAQGHECVSCIKEFLQDQDVIVIPAFKYEHVWSNDMDDTNNSKNVLVAFPISIDSSIRILETLIRAYMLDTQLHESGVNFILKTHPKNSNNEILNQLTLELPDNFMFTEEKSFPKNLKNSSILVTEASSTCLEAMAYGISVIIVENPSGLTYDPIPNEVDEKLYRKTRNERSLIKSLTYFLSLDEDQLEHQRKLGLDLRNNYFEPVTKEGTQKFLGIGV